MEKGLWQKLNEQKTFRAVFRLIPEYYPMFFSMLLLCFISTVPLIRTVFVFIFDTDMRYGDSVMFFLNMAIAIMGFAVAVFMLFWYRFNRTDKLCFSALVKENGLPVFLLSMLIWSFIACIFSSNPYTSFYGSLYRKEGVAAYIIYAFVFFLATQIKRRNLMRIIAEVSTLIAALLAIVCLLNNQALFDALNMTRISGIFYNSNHYGYYLCMMTMTSIWLIITDEYAFKKTSFIFHLLHYIELALIVNSLVLCNTLGTFLGVIAGIIIFTAFVFISGIARNKRLETVVIIIFILLVIIFSSFGTWDIIADLAVFFNDISLVVTDTYEELGVDPGSGRMLLWTNGIQFALDSPLVGHGPDNLEALYTSVGATNDRPHNELIQFAASMGFPALIFYVAGFVWLLIQFIKKFKHVDIFILSQYCIVAAYLLSSFFGNTMFYTSPFFFMLLGMCFSEIKRCKR